MIDLLKKSAIKAGLAAVGIAPAIDEVRAEYAWAESVVVAAISYLPPEEAQPDDNLHGLVARVARSADYHDVLRNKLSQLAKIIRTQYPDARLEVCVDTCPLPERKLAVLGGIAWRGKNGNVFVEGCGSYAALGEIVTDIRLPVSKPILEDKCGECQKCITACPAKAITASYIIDTNKCLSSLTQMSGVIPADMRNRMGNRIYGCDICQEVCPQNASISPISPNFAQKCFPGTHPELLPLINLSAKEYKTHIAQSSIGWIRRTRIRRNTAIAAGNLKCKEAVPALKTMLSDENSVLRIHAAWALGEIGNEEALASLEKALNNESDLDVIKEIRPALSKE